MTLLLHEIKNPGLVHSWAPTAPAPRLGLVTSLASFSVRRHLGPRFPYPHHACPSQILVPSPPSKSLRTPPPALEQGTGMDSLRNPFPQPPILQPSLPTPFRQGRVPQGELLGWSPFHTHRADRLPREVQRQSRKARCTRTPRRLLRKLSRCVPAQEEEEKGGGRIEADHPPPASSVSRRGKEEANWFVAQNSVGNRVMENDGWKVAKK